MSVEQRILFLSEAPGCHQSRELRAIAFQVRKREDRIKQLEEFVEQLHNPKFTIEDLPKEALLQRIKRLEDAGDAMERWCSDWEAASNWDKAKEDK